MKRSALKRSFMAGMVILVMFMVWIGPKQEVHACSCAEPPPVEEALERATRVFSGEVIEIVDPGKNKWIRSSNEPIEVIVKVDRVWKGNVGRQATVTTALSTASCGYPFAIGESYLIYASDLGETDTNLCGRTAKLSNAEADLLVLGEGDIPRYTPHPQKASIHFRPYVVGGVIVMVVMIAIVLGLWRFLARRKGDF